MMTMRKTTIIMIVIIAKTMMAIRRRKRRSGKTMKMQKQGGGGDGEEGGETRRDVRREGEGAKESESDLTSFKSSGGRGKNVKIRFGQIACRRETHEGIQALRQVLMASY